MLCKCLLFLKVTHFTTSSEVPGEKKQEKYFNLVKYINIFKKLISLMQSI